MLFSRNPNLGKKEYEGRERIEVNSETMKANYYF